MLVSDNRVTESDREGKRLLRILGLVALGGVLGAVARALIEAAWPHSPDTIGWATLVHQRVGLLPDRAAVWEPSGATDPSRS